MTSSPDLELLPCPTRLFCARRPEKCSALESCHPDHLTIPGAERGPVRPARCAARTSRRISWRSRLSSATTAATPDWTSSISTSAASLRGSLNADRMARTVSHASVALGADSSPVSSLEALHGPPPIRQRREDLRCPGQRWMVRRLRSTPGAYAVGDVDPVAERGDVRSPACGLLHALGTREARAALAQPLWSDCLSVSHAARCACPHPRRSYLDWIAVLSRSRFTSLRSALPSFSWSAS